MYDRRTHLYTAHAYWKSCLNRGDFAIDATCGNGKDSLRLGQLTGPEGTVVSLDIQQVALDQAALLCKQEGIYNVKFFLQSHETFPKVVTEKSVKLIVYNLGYLPKGDKSITTVTKSTILSLKQAFQLVAPGGSISLTAYPGHAEGKNELEALFSLFQHLNPKEWHISQWEWGNRTEAPTLFFLKKSNNFKDLISL